ncbi:MAG: autotransporter outer membrane beta-barrel domain-containing protein [Planctomycetia bacterium]|nr:autotransporter outer membrane beta-barrel domain-containing protein [Planctomycetia bacterium]
MDKVKTPWCEQGSIRKRQTFCQYKGFLKYRQTKGISDLMIVVLIFAIMLILSFPAVQTVHAQIPGVTPGLSTISDTTIPEVASQGTIAIETLNYVFTNVKARLDALRLGSESMKRKKLLGMNEELPPANRYAGPITSIVKEKSVNTDESRILDRLGTFVSGTGSFGDKDTTNREAGFDFNTVGAIAGLDYKLTDNVILGTMFGYNNKDVDFDSSSDSLDINGYNGSIYGTCFLNNFYLDGIVSFGWDDYDSKYKVNDSRLKGNPDGTQFASSMSTGYDFNIGGFTIGPVGRVNYSQVDIEGHQIKGDSETKLEIDHQDAESLKSFLGVEASYAFKVPKSFEKVRLGVVVPQIRLEWVHEYENDSRDIDANFVNISSGTPLRFSTDSPDRDYLNLGLGLSSVFAGGISAYVYYETPLGLDDVTTHNISGGVRIEF